MIYSLAARMRWLYEGAPKKLDALDVDGMTTGAGGDSAAKMCAEESAARISFHSSAEYTHDRTRFM